MDKARLYFSEAEHSGDVENYSDDIKSSGADVLDWDIDIDSEEANILIETKDFNTFMGKFATTDSFGFLDSYAIVPKR